MVEEVFQFFKIGYLLKTLNATLLVLIPKSLAIKT